MINIIPNSNQIKKAIQIGETCSKEDIYYYYNDFIYYNIKNMVDKGFNFKWIHPKYISLEKGRDLTPKIKDPYLEGSDYLTKLAISIKKIGTYWPILTLDEEEGYIAAEGKHRITAIHLLCDKGEWGDKKVLCFVSPKGDEFSKTKVNMHIPYLHKNPEEEISDKTKSILIDVVASGFGEICSIYEVYPFWLNHMFFSYKSKNKETIKPHSVINSEACWNEFIRRK